MYWTYGDRNHQYHNGVFTQRWYYLDGVKNGDGYTFEIFEVREGRFLFYDAVNLVPVGEARLSITDENHMSLFYDLNAGPGNIGRETLDLVRLL